MTNKEAMEKIIKRIEEYFKKTGKVGFPELDLSEFKGVLILSGTKLGGDMDNFAMKIEGSMDNIDMEIEGCVYNNGMEIEGDMDNSTMEIGKNKIGIDSVIDDKVER